MKGTLIKREDRYDLYNESDGSKIASTAPNPQSKLSIINCESIEKGYSIEEIDALFKKVPHTVQNEEDYWKCRAGFITGFQTAMEILGDKKFSEEDMINAHYNAWIDRGEQITYPESRNRYFKSIQKTEWDVEIITEKFFEVKGNDGIVIRAEAMEEFGERNDYKLDADGCLVLKRK